MLHGIVVRLAAAAALLGLLAGALPASAQDEPQDYAKLREQYEKAAGSGDAAAMAALGRLYIRGHGVPQDYAKGREWLEKALAAGDTVAMIDMGQLYASGQGGPQATSPGTPSWSESSRRRWTPRSAPSRPSPT